MCKKGIRKYVHKVPKHEVMSKVKFHSLNELKSIIKMILIKVKG